MLRNCKKFKVSKSKQCTLRNAIYHPNPDVQRRCFAVLLLTFLFSARLVAKILDLTPQSVRNYWALYKKGGIEALQKNNHKGKSSALSDYQNSIEEELKKKPPASIKEAASRIEKITRVKRSLKAVRNFLKINLNLRYRKVGGIPAKADSEKQKRFLDDHLEPLLKKARKGSHVILFVDAAHFVHSAFLGFLWSAKRIFVKTPSGRKRFNVLGAVNAITRELHYICNDTYINAETVCDLLRIIAKNYSGKTITLVLDNARYQKCRLVTSVAIELKINLLFLPSYSPNLNLIERLWKFIKKQSLNSKYYEKFSEFQNAILQSLEKANGEWRKELRTLLTLKFQTFSIEKNEDVA